MVREERGGMIDDVVGLIKCRAWVEIIMLHHQYEIKEYSNIAKPKLDSIAGNPTPVVLET